MALLVNDVTPTKQYTATAGQTVFAYPFAIFEDEDLKVYQVSSSGTPDDTNDILTLTTHYTVSGAGTTSGGNVTLVTGATVGDIITIQRDLSVKRTTDYQNLGDLASTSFNDDLDKLIMMVQQNENGLNRALTLANSTQVSGNFDVDDPVAGYFARAKADLSGIEWIEALSQGSLAVSAYIQTLLDDATSQAARATLEIFKEGVYRGIAGGTADALTVSLSPTMPDFNNTPIIFVRALLANATTTPTINFDGLGAKTIVKNGSQALVAGDISGVDHDLILKYNAVNDEVELLNPATISQSQINTASLNPIVQIVRTDDEAVATGTTQMVHDNTIPQSTEGDQYLSQAITPTSASNLLEVEVHLHTAVSGAARTVMALFKDSDTDALSATVEFAASANENIKLIINYQMVAGTTSPITFKVRAGQNIAGTFTVNGEASNARYNGTINSFIKITEIMQ